MMENIASKNIRIIAKIGRIFGVLLILLFLIGFMASLHSKGNVHFLYLLGLLFFAISFLVSGTFMLKLKQWARYLFIIQMCLIVARGIWITIEWVSHSHFSFAELFDFSPAFITHILFPAGCIYYLTRPKVKEQFK